MLLQENEIYQAVGELYMATRILNKQIESLVRANEELKKNGGDIPSPGLSGAGSVERFDSSNNSAE